MKDLLYLVHRLPYPPNKGDKISSYNFLRHFSRRFRVHLGSFVDDPADWQYAPKVRELCADVCIQGLNPQRARLASLRGLLLGEPLTLPYYRNRRLQAWVDRVLNEVRPAAVFIYSGAMAQFVPHPGIRSILNLEDVDSDKFRSYGEQSRWPLSWLYRREARRLLTFERGMAAAYGVTAFISRAEADLFRRLAPEVASKVTYRTQGVDSAYFDPAGDYPNPYGDGERVLVFTGAMDYRPNVDAVSWFAEQVFPRILVQVPEARFCIVGMNPSDAVRRLGERPGIQVTGGVPDVRPYLAHAAAAALPLRIARGIQNKVLEAMSMQRPVLATPAAMEGIEPCPGFAPLVEAEPEPLALAAVELLRRGAGDNAAGRACILAHYDWEANLRRISDLLDADG